jgi:hypothetical protein
MQYLYQQVYIRNRCTARIEGSIFNRKAFFNRKETKITKKKKKEEDKKEKDEKK